MCLDGSPGRRTSFWDVMLSMWVLTGGALPIWWRAWKHTDLWWVGVRGGGDYPNQWLRTGHQSKTDLNKELGAFNINDERDWVVHRHAPRPVTFGDERGEPSTSTVPHGQVDDQIKVILFQIVHDAALLLFGRTPVVILLKRPIDCCHLKPDKFHHLNI